MMQKKGFTLAEVLITLSIIGVVAALTIPAITASTNEARARASVKKALSVLNQALTLSIAQEGLSANGVATGTGASKSNLANLFGNYLTTLATNSTNANLTTSDGMIYTFYLNGTTGCNSPTNNVPNTATCLVEVDINGNSGSNTVSSKTSYADLYYFIIKDTEVVPANTPTGSSFSIPTELRGSGQSLTDDVAQDILLK